MSRVCIILNPAAGRGRGQTAFSRVRDTFAAHGILDVRVTVSAGDEARIAEEIVATSDTIVAVGGDGTCARIANVILSGKHSCSLAVVPVGTGNDFAKSIGADATPLAVTAQLVSENASTVIDVGRIDEYHFLNSCGFGFDASVLDASNNVTLLKGNAVYIYAALAQLFSYKGTSLTVDNGPRSTKLMVTVSNGRFLGGAFRIAPEASVLDGLLDVNYIENCGVIERARVFAAAIRGTHERLRAVRAEKRDKLTLEFAEPPLMEVDGELRRARANSVSIECLPRALSVIAAANAVL